MKKLLITCICSLFLFFLFPIEARAISQENVVINFKKTIDFTLLKKYHIDINKSYHNIPSISAQIPTTLLPLLKKEETIQSIERTQPISLHSQQLDWGISHVHIDSSWSAPSPYTGKGVKIAIIDSGVDTQHSDLKIAGGISLVTEKNGYKGLDDLNGHGTHVTGIINAQHNHIGTAGIAPNAEIYMIKAFNKDGTSDTGIVTQAIDWAMNHDIDIINLSMGFQINVDSFKAMVDKAYQKGILIVSAAGNDGTSDVTLDNVDYPARYESTIAVTSITPQNQRSDFTVQNPTGQPTSKRPSTGNSVEIAAPGTQILSTLPNNVYGTMSGTSMATPYVTGILALMKEKFPSLTNKEIRQLMDIEAKDLGVPGKDREFGYGLIQGNVSAIQPLDKTIPLTPIGITVSTSNAKIFFSWKSNKEEDLAGYNLYINNKKLNTLPIKSTTYAVTNLTNETMYQFQLSAVDKSGNESPLSNTMHLTPMAFPNIESSHFTDIPPTYWAYQDIEYVYGKNLMKGRETTQFVPNGTLSRSETAAILVRLLQLKEKSNLTLPFKDLSTTFWGYNDIRIAYQHHLFSGKTPLTFGINDSITRAEMAAVLNRTLSSQPKSSKTMTAPFTDVSKTHWAYQDIVTMNEVGVFGGYSNQTFRPNAKMTRGEMASLLKRLDSMIKK